MLLAENTAVWGTCEIISELPSIRSVEDALVIPQTGPPDHDTRWGVYDTDRRLVEEAALMRGPGRILVGQSERTDVVEATARLEGSYVYGGSAQGHYGHYLLEFLPRYWILQNNDLTEVKFLIHEAPAFSFWMEIPFVRRIMSSLGLSRRNFIAIEEPTIVEELIVPAPSFIVQKRAHSVFSTLCASIGNQLSGNTASDVAEQPLYLSKHKLTNGVWRLQNEDVFTDELVRAGIRVVHPETLEIEEQVALLKQHKTIGGLMGSALHTAIFCDTPKNIVALAHNCFIHSDYVLVDRIKKNNTRFFHATDDLLHHGRTNDFTASFSFKEPKRAGAEFARLLLDG